MHPVIVFVVNLCHGKATATQSDTATLRRAGNLLREIASTEGQSGKAVQKVRYLNDLAKVGAPVSVLAMEHTKTL